MAAALRRLLKPWEEVKDAPSPPHTDQQLFPYPASCLNEAILNPAALQFARRWHDTPHIHYRQGLAMVRYPGFKGDVGHPHIDNGNNSLLPPTSDQRHAQIVFWLFPEGVDPDQAPLRVIATADGGDLDTAGVAAVPAGRAAIFHTYTWHSAGDYRRLDGQRYSWSFGFGRADHYREGVKHYTDQGRPPISVPSSPPSLPNSAASSGSHRQIIPITRSKPWRCWKSNTPAGMRTTNTGTDPRVLPSPYGRPTHCRIHCRRSGRPSTPPLQEF